VYILIVDSGGYERNQEHNIYDIYNSMKVKLKLNYLIYEHTNSS